MACRICYTGILWIEVFVGGIPACGYFCVRGCNISVLGGHFVECNRTIGVFYCSLSGGDIMRVIEMKYPKARKLVNYGHDNNLFASYISRAVVVVPGDLVSMIHGALRMPYRPYLLGSIMGVMPEMLVQTYIGAQLKHLTIKSVLVMIALIAATLAFSLILNKKVSRSGKQMDKEDF